MSIAALGPLQALCHSSYGDKNAIGAIVYFVAML